MHHRSCCRWPLRAHLVGLVLAAAAGCGGLASSRETSNAQTDSEIAEEVSINVLEDAPGAMPPGFDVLELRQLFDAEGEGEGALLRCEYATRIKINRGTTHLITSACAANPSEAGWVSLTSNALLDPPQLAAVQDAYGQVRASSARKCTSAARILTLALEVDREELLFADDDHAGCPAPAVQSTRFVSGLPELYARLEQLQGR